MKLKIQRVPAGGGPATVVSETVGKVTQPRWSPDGKWIAWLGATALNDPYAGTVFVAPAAGGAADNLTPGYDGTATWLSWLPGAPSTLALVAIERQNTPAYTIALPAKTRTPIATGSASLLGGLSFSGNGARTAFAASTPAASLRGLRHRHGGGGAATVDDVESLARRREAGRAGNRPVEVD